MESRRVFFAAHFEASFSNFEILDLTESSAYPVTGRPDVDVDRRGVFFKSDAFGLTAPSTNSSD